ncbi:MAG: transcriptional repressor [Ardenticatenaceae bacterium]|nr:transcriptional repressor [Anaerolineales bacterium]MCB8984144.1 transcriptional repressor [Ardenticatenaceae bacterium]
MSHQEQHFAEKIRAQGYRLTPQRQLVLDALCAMGGHATAGEVFEQVSPQMPALNQATVYRTLEFLVELRMVARSDITGQTVYEIVGEQPHYHLVCRRCEHVYEMAADQLTDLADWLLAEHGFRADLDHLIITGVCAHCQTPTTS